MTRKPTASLLIHDYLIRRDEAYFYDIYLEASKHYKTSYQNIGNTIRRLKNLGLIEVSRHEKISRGLGYRTFYRVRRGRELDPRWHIPNR